MADIADMLKGILDDPETGDKLRSLFGDGTAEKHDKPEGLLSDGIDPAMLMKVTKAMKKINGKHGDSRTRLLHDLKPYVSPGRCRKVDEAIEILKLLWILDMFKDDFGKGGDLKC